MAESEVPDIDTLAIHGDAHLDDAGAVVAPIFQTVSFHSRDLAAVLAETTQPRGSRFCLRRGNPTTDHAAALIARPEGGEDALVTASGMAAVSTAVLSNLRQGDHVVGQLCQYAATNTLLDDVLPRFGVAVSRVDQQRPEAFAEVIRPETKALPARDAQQPPAAADRSPRRCRDRQRARDYDHRRPDPRHSLQSAAARSVLLAPGRCFGVPLTFRVGIGAAAPTFKLGVERLAALLGAGAPS